MPRLLSICTRPLAIVATVASFLLVSAGALWAEAPTLSAPEAEERLATESFVLLDIRTPEEWSESGVAEGAWPVSMHTEDFPQRLQAILQHYRPDQIGLICATGSRSGYVARVLEQNGLTGVADISEGMFGNPSGDGWIARGLSVVSAEEALARYENAQASWSQ